MERWSAVRLLPLASLVLMSMSRVSVRSVVFATAGTGPAVRDFLIQQTGSSPPALDAPRRPKETTTDASSSSGSSGSGVDGGSSIPSKL